MTSRLPVCSILAAWLPLSAAQVRFEAVEPCMGTLFRVTLYARDSAEARRAFDAAFAEARRLEASISDYHPDSELNRLCRRSQDTVSRELFDVLLLARQVAANTAGAFDPTAGPLVRLWRVARKTGVLPDAAAIASARQQTGWEKIVLNRRGRRVKLTSAEMRLDLGGIGKGFAADRMLAELRRLGIRRALVAASGDLAIGDPPPGERGWRVGLGSGGSVELLRNCGVSTSGDSEQYAELGGVRYSHIIDPRSGWALRDSQPVTVVAKTASLADALATAGSVDPQTPAVSAYGARIIR